MYLRQVRLGPNFDRGSRFLPQGHISAVYTHNEEGSGRQGPHQLNFGTCVQAQRTQLAMRLALRHARHHGPLTTIQFSQMHRTNLGRRLSRRSTAMIAQSTTEVVRIVVHTSG